MLWKFYSRMRSLDEQSAGISSTAQMRVTIRPKRAIPLHYFGAPAPRGVLDDVDIEHEIKRAYHDKTEPITNRTAALTAIK